VEGAHPAAKPAPDDAMPENLQELARLRASYNDNAGQWWRAASSPTIPQQDKRDKPATRQAP
jgi:hypothetical protein